MKKEKVLKPFRTDQDQITNDVIEYGKMLDFDDDIEDLLQAEDDFQVLNINFLTKRPPPFAKEKDFEVLLY